MHAREPWSWHEDKEILLGGDGCFICTVRDLLEEEDAERIIACVNACQGYSTKQLQKFGRFISSGEKNDVTEALANLLDKIEVMNGCNDSDFDVKCSDVAWPEFHAAHAALAAIRTAVKIDSAVE